MFAHTDENNQKWGEKVKIVPIHSRKKSPVWEKIGDLYYDGVAVRTEKCFRAVPPEGFGTGNWNFTTEYPKFSRHYFKNICIPCIPLRKRVTWKNIGYIQSIKKVYSK
jgi:hypothetical protein